MISWLAALQVTRATPPDGTLQQQTIPVDSGVFCTQAARYRLATGRSTVAARSEVLNGNLAVLHRCHALTLVEACS